MNLLNVSLPVGKKAYFISDIHLGMFPYEESRQREKRVVQWLRSIQPDAGVLFLMGDVFDYWYEYSKVVPRGYVRFLGALAELADSGVEIHYFTGNHDVWVFDYLPTEIGLTLHRKPREFDINGKRFFLGHGDGLIPSKDRGYTLLKSCFDNPVLQWMYTRLHPNFSMWIGQKWSKNSRLSKGIFEPYLGDDKEFQVLFANDYVKQHAIDYFVFGHRHWPMEKQLDSGAVLINLGEWIISNTYASFDGHKTELHRFTANDQLFARP